MLFHLNLCFLHSFHFVFERIKHLVSCESYEKTTWNRGYHGKTTQNRGYHGKTTQNRGYRIEGVIRVSKLYLSCSGECALFLREGRQGS